MARGRDRILRCIGRTGYPARKPIRKAPAQKARRGWLRILTPRTSSEADPSILFFETQTPPKPASVSAGWTEEQVWAADPSPASGPAPRGAGSAPARPGAKSQTSKRQPILPVGLHDGALPASFGNSQLRGSLGTLGLIHDLLAECSKRTAQLAIAEAC